MVTAVCHVLAVVAIFLSNIPLAIQLVIITVVIASLCYNHRQDKQTHILIWRAGNRWVIKQEPRTSIDPETDMHANRDDDKRAAAALHRIDFFSRWLVILTLRTESGDAKKFVIPYDALPSNTFRLLRVRLRIEGFGLLNPEKKP